MKYHTANNNTINQLIQVKKQFSIEYLLYIYFLGFFFLASLNNIPYIPV